MKRKSIKPRNPFVAAAKFKRAGAHGKTGKALRRAAKMETERDGSSVGSSNRLLPDRSWIRSPPVPPVQYDIMRMAIETAPGAGGDSVHPAVATHMTFIFLGSQVGKATHC